MTERAARFIVGTVFMILGLVMTISVGRHYHGDPAVLFGASAGCAFGYGVAVVAQVGRAGDRRD